MSEKTTTFAHWPEPLRLKRGLLNGERVQMAREFRGMLRHVLARKLGIPSKELARREGDWCLWDDNERTLLAGLLNFPLAFFAQDDAPALAPGFMCGHDEEGNSWCEYIEAKE